MIYRDNYVAVAGDPLCPEWTMSIARSQWGAAADEIRSCRRELDIVIHTSRWLRHAAGYLYREIIVIGRDAGDACNRIAEAIRYIRCS